MLLIVINGGFIAADQVKALDILYKPGNNILQI